MGTRNLTFVFKDGEYKVAQYGQWDGYPSGQGQTVLEFARDQMNREHFLANLAKCRAVDHAEVARRWREAGASEDGRASLDVSDRFQKQWPHLSRDMGAKILLAIQNAADGLDLYHDTGFAADSLMCGWAYVIDFDAGTLEAFKGFNKTPLEPTERFASFPLPDRSVHNDYLQIKLAKSWPLDALPSDDEFIAALSPNNEDEAEAAA